ncbi:MAG TPA: transglycosylase SLT domain-containing protein [Casimicrobiaceae bacterium]|jgi:soluble lytic murein transglycosylase-like protein|nr:transglycosylase SLT domain-containing protein [Casimicrobiaceae bacterium]
MTAGLRADFRIVQNESRRRELSPVVARLALASAALALIGASSGRFDGTAANEPLLPAASGAKVSTIALRPTRLTPSAVEENIETLARVVGIKYRISHDITREFVGTAYLEAKRNRLDPLLIVAVMAVESGFNPAAQSDGGAIGLMQVIPRYHPDKFSAARGESVRDPSTNIRVGSQALKEYIVRGGTEAAGLQLYNGAAGDTSNAYATKVAAERQRLQDAMRRARERA